MNVIPAVDLKGGQCVRLLQGKRDEETHYSDDPVAMARHWEEAGAERLHLVDLDGAFDGDSENKPIIKDILGTLDIPCEVGGGIRSAQAVESILGAGADAVIIGTAGVNRPSWLRELVEEFGPDKVYAGVDCRDGRVMVKGWEETSAFELLEWVTRLEDMGLETIIYTDVDRDGAEVGPDYEGTGDILRESELNVIASGGVGSLEHLRGFEDIVTDQLVGVIVGRALYEDNFDFADAQRALSF
jgi:phosphoribosylformimino-5-aminoimidazole carboxamide ribotide isomerase